MTWSKDILSAARPGLTTGVYPSKCQPGLQPLGRHSKTGTLHRQKEESFCCKEFILPKFYWYACGGWLRASDENGWRGSAYSFFFQYASGPLNIGKAIIITLGCLDVVTSTVYIRVLLESSCSYYFTFEYFNEPRNIITNNTTNYITLHSYSLISFLYHHY